MEKAKAIEAPKSTKPAESTPEPLTLEILIVRMMQTRRDVLAYEKGEMTLDELQALGVRIG